MNKRLMRREIGQILFSLSDGLFSYAIDVSLWLTVYLAELSLPGLNNNEWKAGIAADRFLYKINYEVIKNAIKEARRRGLVKKSRRHAFPQITTAGKQRLKSLIPQYDEKRIWDGRIHLITYDIPEKRRHKRNMFRIYLIRRGCAKLQKSVWLTPYNPIDTLRNFIDGHNLSGTVIVSDLGTDGAIGEENLKELLIRTYVLKKLNDRYSSWLEENDQLDHWSAIKYLSILRDDPQLPFSLLPKWWKGDLAYQKIMPYLKKMK